MWRKLLKTFCGKLLAKLAYIYHPRSSQEFDAVPARYGALVSKPSQKAEYYITFCEGKKLVDLQNL